MMLGCKGSDPEVLSAHELFSADLNIMLPMERCQIPLNSTVQHNKLVL